MTSHDPQLSNPDLAPVPLKERTWGKYSVFAMWMAIIHSLANYTFAAGLFILGMPPWQIVAALLIGVLIDLWFMNRMGIIGHRTGAPFAVIARASFGVFGANIPAIVRAATAIAWYGIQTWLASSAVVLLAVQLAPGLAPFTKGGFLGLSPIGWLAFLFLSALQMAILSRGMEYIRKLQDYITGPVVWIAMVVAAVWLMWQSGWKINLAVGIKPMSAGDQLYQFLAAIGLTTATWFTLILNFADYARFTKSESVVKVGNRLGLPINYAAFALASVLTSIGALAVFGKEIVDPVQLIALIDNPAVTIVGAVVFIVATLGINVVGNFVSSSYDISNMSPRHISFKRGGLISAVIAVVILPWNLYSSPAVINYFLGGLAALLAPLVAIILVDYYIVRHEHIDVDELYSARPGAMYLFRHGFNIRAIASFAITAAVTETLALVPWFSPVAPFSWIAGLGVAGGLYLLLMRAAPEKPIRAAASSSPDRTAEAGGQEHTDSAYTEMPQP